MGRPDRENLELIVGLTRHMRFVHPDNDIIALAARNGVRARIASLDARANAKALIDPSKPVWTKGGMPVARLTWLPAPHSMWVGHDPEGNPWLWHSGDGRREDDAYSLTNVEPTTRSRRDGS